MLIFSGHFHLSKARNRQEIPFRNVIAASIDTKTRVLKVTYLYKKKKNSFALFVAEGQVKDTELDQTSEWVEALLNASYDGNCFYSLQQFLSI